MATEFRIDRYLNIRAANAASFSPDGRFITFISNITGVAQLWQLPVEGGWPTQLTFTGESVRLAHYSPVRHELVFGMDAGGNERTQIYQLTGVGSGMDHGLGDGWVTRDLSRRVGEHKGGLVPASPRPTRSINLSTTKNTHRFSKRVRANACSSAGAASGKSS